MTTSPGKKPRVNRVCGRMIEKAEASGLLKPTKSWRVAPLTVSSSCEGVGTNVSRLVGTIFTQQA